MKVNPYHLSVLLAGIIACMPLDSTSMAQERSHDRVRSSPNAAVSQTIGTTIAEITYGRPSVRDREIFGGLVPYNEVWRTGANEATTITFSKDVRIEGEPVAAGTYGLFTIPGENGVWTIIFNNVADQWGSNNYNAGEDVLRVQVTAQEAPQMEQMIFYFKDVEESAGKAVFHWNSVRFSFHIEEG